MTSTARPRALILHGGWDGHAPEALAAFAERELLEGFEVTRSDSLSALNAATLSGVDLLLPIWTFGTLETGQDEALLQAVAQGLGVLAWHGAASAFLENRPYKHLLGGQFVAHPGGNTVEFGVDFTAPDPLTRDLDGFQVCTEQYHLLVDPAVEVLAQTRMVSAELPWLAGVAMPVAWKRAWGRGRVFYLSLGHSVAVLSEPGPLTLLRRAARWAVRGSGHSF